MKYKIFIRYKDENGTIKEESVSFTALGEKDAQHVLDVNREVAVRKHGKEKVVSVELKPDEPSES